MLSLNSQQPKDQDEEEEDLLPESNAIPSATGLGSASWGGHGPSDTGGRVLAALAKMEQEAER